MRPATHAAILLIGIPLSLGTVTACVGLDVGNPNGPDGAGGALSSPQAVEALIAGSFTTWFNTPDSGGAYGLSGPTLWLSAASFQHIGYWPFGHSGAFTRVPRLPIRNQEGDSDAAHLLRTWFTSYRVLASLRAALKQIDAGQVDLGNGTVRARAFARYVQGLAHGTVALLYDSGAVSDEDIPVPTHALDSYETVMHAALDELGEAAELAEGTSFTIPDTWMTNEASSAELGRLAHSWRAIFRAAVARTPAERAAVDWEAVERDVAAGITEDWNIVSVPAWYDEALVYGNYPEWTFLPNQVLGMADESDVYQAWSGLGYWEQYAFVIQTPDTRFPQGPAEWEQSNNPGAYYAILPHPTCLGGRAPFEPAPPCMLYRNTRYDSWIESGGPQPLVTVREMRLLLAEAAYRRGALGEVAEIINETRTLHGLNATDASGLNTSCVPKLPDGTCGDLWEMLKWEKRLEAQWLGPFRAGWYFDSRGWGDLAEGTFLQVPVPYSEMLILGRQPYTFGGVGGNWAAPVGTYGY